MTSGLDCDDNNEESPGYEDRMWEQSNPDFYAWTMNLGMVSDPGKDWVYLQREPEPRRRDHRQGHGSLPARTLRRAHRAAA